ncbi:uncharacterized protein [Euphorbia lathyris]|uniref:uncharacterized protein n=1 Tax=Euphorbia lathyris TaxID=212925 RepID=UPI0033130B29
MLHLISNGLLCWGTWNEAKRVEGLNNINIVHASASGVVSAAIGDDHALWVSGKSKRGQLGLGKGITEAFTPTRVEALSGEKIVQVSLVGGMLLLKMLAVSSESILEADDR